MSKAVSSQSKNHSKSVSAQMIMCELGKYIEPHRVRVLSSFFKTGKGQYGEGDVFLGITVPHVRLVAQKYTDVSLDILSQLLRRKEHEYRLCALHILVLKVKSLYRKSRNDNIEDKKDLVVRNLHKSYVDFYLAHIPHINNWDLVDTSARDVYGGYVYRYFVSDKEGRALLRILKGHSKSVNLWERRIAVITTHYGIVHNIHPEVILDLTLYLAQDKQDLIHKALGWMLREFGKKHPRSLVVFLDKHACILPRTTLRYAIEKMGPAEHRVYMNQAISAEKV